MNEVGLGAMSDPRILTFPCGLRAALDALALARGQEPAQAVEAALAEYLDGQTAWPVHLERALKQADAGEMATPDEVARFSAAVLEITKRRPENASAAIGLQRLLRSKRLPRQTARGKSCAPVIVGILGCGDAQAS